jgi:hypothetical protein
MEPDDPESALLGDEGALQLVQVLSRRPGVTSLDLSNNRIDADGAHSLAALLPGMASLASVQLEGNPFRDAGASVLGARAMLCCNTSITSLNLNFCCIGVTGSTALARALYWNSTLQSLYLRGNNLGDEGTASLMLALRANTSLLILDLGENDIRSPGGRAVAEMLTQNSSLTSLNLRMNHVWSEWSAISLALHDNLTMSYLLGLDGLDCLLERNKMILLGRKQKVRPITPCSCESKCKVSVSMPLFP